LTFRKQQSTLPKELESELQELRRRVVELEGAVNETVLEFFQTLQHLPNLICKIGANGEKRHTLTMMEGKLARQLRIPVARMIGKSVEEILPAKLAKKVQKSLVSAYKGKQVEFELPYQQYTLYVTLIPVIVNGEVLELVASVVDITELKRVQQEKLQLAENFRKTLSMLPNMIFSCTKTAHDRYLLALNEGALAEELAITTDRVAGKAIGDVFPDDMSGQITSGIARAFQGETVENTLWSGERVFHLFVKPVLPKRKKHIEEVIGFISEATQLKRAENVLHQIAQGISTATGDAFFRSLVQHLCSVLDVDSAILGEWRPEQPDLITTIAIFSRGGIQANFQYSLPGTPCEQTLRLNNVTHLEGVAKLFPEDKHLGPDVTSYMGIPLCDSRGRVLGILAVLDTKPIRNHDLVESMLRIFAIRAATELERKWAEQKMMRTNAILKATQESAIDGILIMDENRTVLDYNKQFLTLWELTPEEVDGKSGAAMMMRMGKMINNPGPIIKRMEELLQSPFRFIREELTLKDGRVYDIYTRPVISGEGQTYGRIWYFRDISERIRYEEQIKQQSYFDTLTGLPNRVLFQDRLRLGLAQAQRSGKKLAILFLNLNRFKLINATFGHLVGDRAIQMVAERLSHCLQEGDTISRIGGDEFIMLLPGISQAEDAAKIAHQLQDELGKPLMVDGNELFLTASIGISLYPDDGHEPMELVRNANAAMYRAKEKGRSNYELFTSSLHETAFERLSLENDLRKALEKGELQLHYQPRIKLETNELVGMEALIRWHHPQLGPISPGRFIPLAEETDLIIQIDQYVLERACAQTKAWQDAGYPPIRVAVNISARHFQQGELVDTVAAVLAKTGLDKEYLELEITESAAMHNATNAIRTIHQLRELGIHIAIDDFGTGYSSLSYLKKFPIKTLKIDQSFVRDITVDPDDAAIVSYIITLGHSLKLNVVAEGVETEEQRSFLVEGKCNEMQGYLFSKPLPPEQFEELMKKHKS